MLHRLTETSKKKTCGENFEFHRYSFEVMSLGTILLEEEPYAHVLVQKQRGLYCDRCLNRGEKLKKCTACGFVLYCDRVCQRRDWTVHKQECKCLKNVLPKIPMDSVRLMLRLIISRNLQLPMNSIWSRSFDDLMSHAAEIKEDVKRSEQFVQMLFTLQQYAGDTVSLPSSGELFEMFGKMSINSFTIWDGELQSIGTGIYLSASMLDHSCEANAVITFHGNTLVVRSLQQITTSQPYKIRISYIDQLAPSSARKRQLKEQYYFDCDCPRCLDEQLDKRMSGVRCPKPNCDGCVTTTDDHEPVSCMKCGIQDFSEKFKTFGRTSIQCCIDTLEKIEAARKNHDSLTILSMCKECLAKVKPVLHKFNIHLVRLFDRGLDAAIDEEQWELALNWGLETLEPYRELYPDRSPQVGIQLMKVGKLQLYLGELAAALKSLHQAQDILWITHGEKHTLCSELSLLKHQCEEEMRMQFNNGLLDNENTQCSR